MPEQITPPYLVEQEARSSLGFRERVLAASPAAGAELTVTMDSRYVTRMVSIFLRLVTDATAANREVVVEYLNGAGQRFQLAGAGLVITASTTVDYVFMRSQGQAEWSVDGSVLVPLSSEELEGSEAFKIHVVNIQATDALSRIRYTWERFYSDSVR
jgi:hypothetical protein